MKNDETNMNEISREPRNEGGRGLVIGLMVALVLVLIIGTVVVSKNNKNRASDALMLQNQKLEMTNQLSQRDSIINGWVTSFNEIESDIQTITAQEHVLTMQSTDPEISKDKKAEILKELAYVKGMIDSNKKKLAVLNSQLHNSGIKIASLQSQIDTLNASIAKRDNEMAALRTDLESRNVQIGQLNQKVGTMQTAILNDSTKISQQTAELNKAYIVSGTYKALKEKGVLVKEGGVLGLGKKESLQENFKDDHLFTQVDITKTKTIPVNSKSAKLVTEHPASSYKMVKDESNKIIAYIEIEDPASFWKLSKYAVVEVNN
jgi:outer membrane murein-binding lipoprotein Lpp